MTTEQVDVIVDESRGYFVMIQNIVFKMGLSMPAERCYMRLKWQAGADLKPLPKQERYIAKRIGVSRPAWNRSAAELLDAGLIYYDEKSLMLTDLIVINHRWATGKLSLQKAREQIKGEKVHLGPKSGQKAGPKSGQKAGPKSGHMINNMKNNNMCQVPSSSKLPTHAQGSQADDDDRSIHDLETVRKYAEHLDKIAPRRIRNVEGLALSMRKTGVDDVRINKWLREQEPQAAPVDNDPYAVFRRIVGLSMDLAKLMKKNPHFDGPDHIATREAFLDSGAITHVDHYSLMVDLALARLENKHMGVPDELIDAKRKEFRKAG